MTPEPLLRGDSLQPFVTTGQIKTVVELELRRAGVTIGRYWQSGITGDGEAADADIWVSMISHGTTSTGFAVSVRLHVARWVTIGSERVYVTTWNKDGLITAGNDVGQLIKDQVRQMTMDLLNDYLKANPRQKWW